MAVRDHTYLLYDHGAAASSRDFFRCPEFLAAEGVSHSLCFEEDGDLVMAAPIIVRNIPGTTLQDAISPYSFPGSRVYREATIDPCKYDWSSTHLVSIFLRNRVGKPPVLTEGTLRGTVQIVDPRLPRSIRRNHRTDITRNGRLGFQTTRKPGRDTTEAERRAFRAIYLQTMARQGAEPWYFFSDRYFDAILSSDLAWYLGTVSASGEPAAGIIVVYSDAMLHCFLAGTADQFLAESPGKNTFAAAIEMAEEEGLPLNLGGGMRPGDSLEHFKSGFANTTEPWYTHEIICDADTYCRMSENHEDSGFFPRYRGRIR